MSESPAQLDELIALADAQLRGSLAADQVARLDALLTASPELRTAYLDLLLDAAALRRWASQPGAEVARQEATERRSDEATKGKASIRLAPSVAPSLRRFVARPIYALAAALLLAAAAVAIYVFAFNSKPETRDSKLHSPIATVIDASGNGTLVANDVIVAPGSEIPPGDVSLDAGFAEFRLNSNVDVRLKGQTRLTITDDMHATLTAGSASFDCPHSAKGYTVHLPDGSRVVDLGTAFRVDVDASGRIDLHVTDGRVRWHPAQTDAEPTLVTAGHRLLIADGRIVESGKLRPEPITPEMGLRIADFSSQFISQRPAYDRRAIHLVDGSGLTGDTHATSEGTMWESTGVHPKHGSDPLPAHVTFDLGKNHAIEAIHVWNYNEPGVYKRSHPLAGVGAKDVEVWVSPTANPDDLVKLETSSGDFTFPMASGADGDPGFGVDLGSVLDSSPLRDVRLVRFVILAPHVNIDGNQLVGLSEVRFVGTPAGASDELDTTESDEAALGR